MFVFVCVVALVYFCSTWHEYSLLPLRTSCLIMKCCAEQICFLPIFGHSYVYESGCVCKCLLQEEAIEIALFISLVVCKVDKTVNDSDMSSQPNF